MNDYELLGDFQYRVPLVSLDAMQVLLSELDGENPARILQEFFAQPIINEALFIASKSLHNSFQDWVAFGLKNKKKEERLLLSLLKYALRMSSRCTPFGLFAGVGTGAWTSGETRLVVADKEKVQKHLSLDTDYVYQTTLAIMAKYPKIKLSLRYFANSTLFKVGNTYRFIAYTLTSQKRVYQLQTVAWSAYLEQIIRECRFGLEAGQIIQTLISFEVSKEEAIDFFYQLIESQILVSDLEPRIGDGDYFEQLYDRFVHSPELQRLPNLLPVRKELVRIKEKMAAMTANANKPLDNYPETYEKLLIEGLEPQLPVQQHFLLNSTRPALLAALNSKHGGSLRKALSLLNKLAIKPLESPLKEFRDRFKQRYEERAVPLLEALDPEIGISCVYNASARDEHPLLRGINFKGTPSPETASLLEWNQAYAILLKKWMDQKSKESSVLQIEDDDLEGLTEDWENTPATLQAHFSFVHADGADKILFLSSPYASGLNMINRFTHLDPGTERISQALSPRESASQKNVLVAELIHLPAYPRKLNVLQHLSRRECEVPFLGLVSKACKKVIFLDDLHLAVVKNQFVLYSAEHDAEVKIMLSTALRYSLEAHPIYHFLGDLQYQNKVIPGKFDWGPLRHLYPFLPRVCYKNVIISPATWIFATADLTGSNGKLDLEAVRAFQKNKHLPEMVELLTGDNTLLIDFSKDLCVRLFCQHCQKHKEVIIREYLPPAKDIKVCDEKGESYRSEMVAFFLRKETTRETVPLKLSTAHPPQPRQLDVFSDWLYFKIYCGTQGGEDLLLDQIFPMVQTLLKDKVLKKWFFIRYSDSDYHLRVRFQLQKPEEKGRLLEAMNDQFRGSIQNQVIHKMVVEPYNREIERYGADNIEWTEHLFYIDSMATLTALDGLRALGDENLRWQFLIRASHQMLDDFGLDKKAKTGLLEKLLEGNRLRYNPNVNDRYRALNPGISEILSAGFGEKHLGKPLADLESKRTEGIRKVIAQLSFASTDRFAYIGSCLHMMINRFCLSQPNQQEMVVYKYLLKCYKSIPAVLGALYLGGHAM